MPAYLAASVRAEVGDQRPKRDIIRLGKLYATVANLIASTDLPLRLNISDLAREIGFYYDAEWTKFGVHSPRGGPGKALIYPTGRVVLVGSQSLEDLSLDSKRLLGDLKARGYRVGSAHVWRLDNIVAVLEIPRAIDLGELSASGDESIDYNPDIFPGAVMRSEAGSMVVLAFSSGKLVVTGAKSYSMIRRGLLMAIAKLTAFCP